jgi:hypothetical protein
LIGGPLELPQWRWIAVATPPLVFPAVALAQSATPGQTPDAFRELESKDIFGFTLGSDIGEKVELELENETNIAFQKRTGTACQGASTLGLKTVMTYRITQSMALGGEHTVLTAGPGLIVSPEMRSLPAIVFTNKLFLSAACSTLFAGHAADDANLLDLTDFTRNKARLKLIWEF